MVEGTDQISATLKKNTVNRIIRLKQEGKVEGISDYLQRACDFFDKYHGVTRKDVLIYIVYPWLIAMIFFMWSGDIGYNLDLHVALFYLNLIIFGLVIASIYWLFKKYKKENLEYM